MTFNEAAQIVQTVQKLSGHLEGIPSHPCKCGAVATLKTTVPDFTQEFICQKCYEENMIDTEAKTVSMWAAEAKVTQCCGLPLSMWDTEHYDSDAGWPVLGMDQKQWITIRCARCGTETALWKLGVPRPNHPEDVR